MITENRIKTVLAFAVVALASVDFMASSANAGVKDSQTAASATEPVVSTTGGDEDGGKTIVVNNRMPNAADTNPGTFSQPLKTIQAGANLARPGDTILVKAGIYREEVKPPRGGTKTRPIIYKAADGEEVSIRGSEQVSTWIDLGEGVWKIELPDSFFRGFNPFAVNVEGGWLKRPIKKENVIEDRNTFCNINDMILYSHLGDVYLNGEAYREKFSLAEVKQLRQSWYCENKDGKTTIWSNFGEHNPNHNMTEINARSTAIFPQLSGLKYIVIDGFDIRHTASQWADIYSLEEGAIVMNYGYGWVIQNCRITNSRNNGISMGVSDEIYFSHELTKGGDNIPPYGSFGFHIIRNNIIKRCGQCAIYGCYGAVGSIIENNEFTETAYRKEWAGSNQADIKILFPIDVIIRNNKFYGPDGSGKGIWLDWGSQNTRVTGNLIVDRGWGLFTEVSFGPTITDNNIFINSGIFNMSDGSIYVHNLFYNSKLLSWKSGRRVFVPYYKPHSTVEAGRKGTFLLHTKWYNNIFIGGQRDTRSHKGLEKSYTVNNNICLDEAQDILLRMGTEDIIDEQKSNFKSQKDEKSWEISFGLSEIALSGKHPQITSKFIGRLPLAEMFMENPDGTPLNITTDYFGNAIDPKNVKPGPFQKIGAGANKFNIWPHPGHKDK